MTVNGKAAKKNTKFSAGDTVTVQLPEPEPVAVLPQDIPQMCIRDSHRADGTDDPHRADHSHGTDDPQ